MHGLLHECICWNCSLLLLLSFFFFFFSFFLFKLFRNYCGIARHCEIKTGFRPLFLVFLFISVCHYNTLDCTCRALLTQVWYKLKLASLFSPSVSQVVCLWFILSVFLFCFSIYVSVCLSVCLLSACLSLTLSLCLWLCLSVSLCVSLWINFRISPVDLVMFLCHPVILINNSLTLILIL